MRNKFLLISIILFSSISIAFVTKAKSINELDMQVQTADTPYWQFIHVDPVNPENSGWSHNSAISRMSVISDTLFLSTQNDSEGGEVWHTSNGVSWEQVNTNGFGTNANDTVLVGDTLNGYLYAGTGNPTAGSEIWRCDLCDGSDWEKVIDSGFGDGNNSVIERIILHGGSLYATTNNAVTGVEVWQSASGNPGSWQQCNMDGFGDVKNTELYAAAPFAGYLYVAASQWAAYDTSTQTGVEVWRTTNCTTWEQVNSDGFGNNNNVGAWLETFEGKLYVLGANSVDGTQLWRCTLCDGSDWEHVISDGFGDGGNTAGGMMRVYDGRFYLATGNDITGTEVWRTTDGVSWSQANIDSFNFPDNIDVWSSFVYKNHLYFGTRNLTSGGQVRQLLANPAALTLPKEGEVEVNFISVGGPDDLTGCTGVFGLGSPRSEIIYADYIYSNNLSFPISGYFPQNTDLIFYLTPGNFCELPTGSSYLSTNPDRAFITQPESNTWILSWEDWTDEDFNDLHVEITLLPQIEPFLDLPFDYEGNENYGSFNSAVEDKEIGGTITSYFDHQYPTYAEDGRVITFHGFDSIEDNPGYGLAYDGHDGIDFAPNGENGGSIDVLAAADGTIADIVPATPGTCNCDGVTIQQVCLGNHIVITHTNGLATYYGHLVSFETGLVEGEPVTQGDELGVMGSTGCSDGSHIHFSVDRSGEWPIINPLKIDPFGWLADEFPDSTYGESGNPDPWQAYNQNLTSPRDATSDYLWAEEFGQAVLSLPDIPTTIVSADGEVTAIFPVDAISTAFRTEIWPTLNAPNYQMERGLSPTVLHFTLTCPAIFLFGFYKHLCKSRSRWKPRELRASIKLTEPIVGMMGPAVG